MKLIATVAALALVAAPALAQQPSQSPAPPPGQQAAGVTDDPEPIGPGLGGVQPIVIGGVVVGLGLGVWALSGGGDGGSSTPSTPSTR